MAAEEKKRGVGLFRYAIGGILCIVLLTTLYFLNTGKIRAFEVISASMDPTLGIGDRLLMWKYEKANPNRGDIIVFKSPDDDGPEMVKRVVALPGDSVELKSGTLTVNGTSSPPPGIADVVIPNAKQISMVLAPGQYFVMGDNRTRSHDSTEFGALESSFIIGKVFYRYGPKGRIGSIK